MDFIKPINWGMKKFFPENMTVADNGLAITMTEKLSVKMAEHFDDAIAAAIIKEMGEQGATVQDRIDLETTKVTEEYNKKGFDWLLGEMEALGFLVVDGEVRAFLDDDNLAVTPKRAKREGYDGA